MPAQRVKPTPTTDKDSVAPQDKGLVPLFVPGTTQLPWPFPAVGDVEIQPKGAKFGQGETPGALVIVRRQISPTMKVRWTILAEHVSAFLDTNGDDVDYAKAEWYFRPSVSSLAPLTGSEFRKGIVFVPEDVPVLMSIEIGETASGSIDLISGMRSDCQPCCQGMFSAATVMGGQHQG